MLLNKKPTEEYRVERAKGLEHYEDGGHLWAVSYSDMLMVLLSFFILFFSLGKEKKEDILRQLIPISKTNLAGGSAATGEGGPSAIVAAGPSAKGSVQSPFESLADLESIKIEKSADASSVTLLFPQDIYAAGGYKLGREQRNLIEQILTKIGKDLSKVQMEFVGHSDPSPVLRNKTQFSDNFDISAYRGTEALRYALSLGALEPDQVSAKGAGSTGAGNRTLSIVIKLREKK